MYLISQTNSLTFPKTEEHSAVSTQFHEFQGLILQHFAIQVKKIAIIPTFPGKHVRILESSTETII